MMDLKWFALADGFGEGANRIPEQQQLPDQNSVSPSQTQFRRAFHARLAQALAASGLHVFPVSPTRRPLVRWRDASTHDLNRQGRNWRAFPDALPEFGFAGRKFGGRA
jgi:hypothetical protein